LTVEKQNQVGGKLSHDHAVPGCSASGDPMTLLTMHLSKQIVSAPPINSDQN